VTQLTESLTAVRARVETAARVANRDPAAVRIVAVSKGHPTARVTAVHALGQRDFGENYLQEAEAKIAECGRQGYVWHFIGRLQSNKTRPVAELFDWVHTVDRAKIADRLSAQRGHYAPPLRVCLQVALADEPGKAGVEPERLAALAAHVAGLPRLELRGLMCIPPPPTPERPARPWFRRLRELGEALADEGIPIPDLSMGMSADLEDAVAEGATLVRIGTAIFGPRPQRTT
jgi:hypothetical protein